jgi:hypothetical protein
MGGQLVAASATTPWTEGRLGPTVCRMKLSAFVTAVVLSASIVPAPVSSDPPADARHSLDFWLGDWDVFVGTEKAGTNRIEPVLGGAALLEHWRDADGSEGKSFFYYLPAANRWKQVWIQPPAVVKEKLSRPQPEGAVRFEGRVFLPDGREIPDRTTLTPLPDGRVRQVIEFSRDAGRTWTVGFDAIYVRAKR